MSTSVDSVRAQITVAQNDQVIQEKEAYSIVRSAIGMGVTSTDIKAAIKASKLPKAEQKLLADALQDVPTADKANHTLSAKEGAVIHSNLSLIENDKPVFAYKLQSIVGVDKAEVNLVEASGTFTEAERATMFDQSLAQGYALDPRHLGQGGLTDEMFAKIRTNPEVDAARKAFVESKAPLKTGDKFVIPLPVIK